MSISIGLDTCPVCGDAVGGIPTFVRQLATRLPSIDKDNRYFQCYKFSRFKGRGTLLPVSRALPRIWYGRRFLFPLRKLDIFHGTAEWLPCGLEKTKRILTVHDLRGIRSNSDFDEQCRDQMEALRDPDVAVVTVSHFIRNQLLERLDHIVARERVSVIHLAGNAGFAPIEGAVRKDQILFVGSIAPNKNVLSLLKAFDTIRYRHRETSLVICGRTGNAPYMQTLMQFIADRPGLAESVRFVQDADNAAVRRLYNESRFCILPSTYEGFGIPVIEAQSCGCPVVCSAIGALTEVGGDSVLYCDPQNIGSIAESIETLLFSETRCRNLSAAGFTNAARYSWEDTARGYGDLYRKVAEQKE